MRTDSPNQFLMTDLRTSPQFETKSLFSNILALSPCHSIFYPDTSRFRQDKSFRINSLWKAVQKNQTDQLGEFEANPLFQKILAISRCPSIFYLNEPLSARSKSLRMNILEKRRKKIENSPTFPRLPFSSCRAIIFPAALSSDCGTP